MQASSTINAGAVLFAPLLTFALATAPATAADANAPGVARLDAVRGDVEIKTSAGGDMLSATVNAPLGAGDYLTTGDDARAEVQYPFEASLRVAAKTQLRFTQLDDAAHAVQLAQGTVELRLLRGLDSHSEVVTPGATIRPTENGRYRVTVDGDGNSRITARSGRTDIVTSAGTRTLSPGSTVAVAGSGDSVRVSTVAQAGYDDFDRWNDERDAFVQRTADFSYVDNGYVGADDLAGYGTWSSMSGYGDVWRPANVAPGWAPYHDGRWVWQPYYGWTWVSTEPWGWAPYHYGNWFYAGNCWNWSPGFYGRPVAYAPALVSFFTFGIGIGGLGFGNIGWVPLAPYETLSPWWGGYGGTYDRYVTNVTNITNITNVTNVSNSNGGAYNRVHLLRLYHNAKAPGGMVAVNAANFASGNFEHVVALHPKDVTEAAPVRGIVPLVPTSRNLAFRNAAAQHDATPPSNEAFARLAPVRIAAPTFAEQQRALERVASRTYPHAAAAFSHPEELARYARSGLVTERAVPPAAPHAVAPNAPHSVMPVPPHAVVPAPHAVPPAAPHADSPWIRFEGARPAAPASRNGSDVKSGGIARRTAVQRPIDLFGRFHGVDVLIGTTHVRASHVVDASHSGTLHGGTPASLQHSKIDPFSRFASDLPSHPGAPQVRRPVSSAPGVRVPTYRSLSEPQALSVPGETPHRAPAAPEPRSTLPTHYVPREAPESPIVPTSRITHASTKDVRPLP